MEHLTCKHCGKKLRKGSASGYCGPHRYASSREPASTCAANDCDFVLAPKNKSGYCQDHYRPSQRGDYARCAFERCDTRVMETNTHGWCMFHKHLKSRQEAKRCAVDGCGTTLRADNSDGYCKAHHYERYRVDRTSWPTCAVDGCERHLHGNNKLGLCYEHGADVHDAIRRALKLKAFVEEVRRDVVWKEHDGICHLCGEPADPGDWHRDHVIPLVRGGAESYANSAVSHPRCNQVKHDRMTPSALGLLGAWTVTPVCCL